MIRAMDTENKSLCMEACLNVFVQHSFISLNLMRLNKKRIHITFTGIFLLASTIEICKFIYTNIWCVFLSFQMSVVIVNW